MKKEKPILYGKKKINKTLKPNQTLDLEFNFIYGNKPKDKRFDWGLEKVKIKPLTTKK